MAIFSNMLGEEDCEKERQKWDLWEIQPSLWVRY